MELITRTKQEHSFKLQVGTGARFFGGSSLADNIEKDPTGFQDMIR